MEQIQDEPLTTADSEIRLLKIQPASDEDRIEREVFTSALHDNTPKYAAVVHLR